MSPWRQHILEKKASKEKLPVKTGGNYLSNARAAAPAPAPMSKPGIPMYENQKKNNDQYL